MKHHLIAIAATAVAVAGCSQTPALAPGAAVETNDGIAKTCTPSKVDFGTGSAATATIAMTNDGWCALHVTEKSGGPFKFGLVKAKPQHGYILIQKVGTETRIEYTAENRFVGPDRFSVALASNQPSTPDSTVQIVVTVSRGEGVGLPAPEPTTPGPRSPATPRRPTRR